MDQAPVDYLSGLGGLANLPDSMRAQNEVVADRLGLQRAAMQNQAGQIQLQDAQRQQTERSAYDADVAAYAARPTGQGAAALIVKHPDYAKQVQDSWSQIDKSRQQSDLTQMAGIYSAASNGKADVAARLLRERIKADKVAGEDTTHDEAIADALESGDAEQVKGAVAQMGLGLAAITGPEKFASTYGNLNKSEEGHFKSSPVGIFDDRTGTVTATKPDVSRADVFDANGNKIGTRTVYNGVPVSGEQIEQAALNAVPGAIVTSRARTPEHNAAVGGVANSDHLTDHARDLIPPKGMSMDAFASTLKETLPGLKILNEGDHVHIQPIHKTPGPFMAKPSTPDNGTGGLSQEAIDLAARQGLARGGLIPTGFARNKSAVTAIQNRMAALAGGKDVQSIIQGGQDVKAQQAAVTEFGKGKLGSSVRSLNVAVDHLDQLKTAAAALQNGNIPLFNRISNGYAAATGSARPTNFDAIKKFVMDESVKAIVGAGGGVGDREEAANIVNRANSPEQLQGAVARIQGLIGGQLNGLALQYKSSTGRDDFRSKLSPRTVRTIGQHLDAPPRAAAAVPSDIANILKKYGH
jgi:hypothetical protein